VVSIAGASKLKPLSSNFTGRRATKKRNAASQPRYSALRHDPGRYVGINGDIESRFTKDELLTIVALYWVTESNGTSFLPYYDYANTRVFTGAVEGIKEWTGSTKAPAGFALFPKDISRPPREWAERFFNVQRWTELPRGGHFAAMEEPELLADDLRNWFRPFR